MHFQKILIFEIIYILLNAYLSEEAQFSPVILFKNKKFKNAKTATIIKDAIVILDDKTTLENVTTTSERYTSATFRASLSNATYSNKSTDATTTQMVTTNLFMSNTANNSNILLTTDNITISQNTTSPKNKVDYKSILASIINLYESFRKGLNSLISKSDKSSELADHLKNHTQLQNSLRMLINIANRTTFNETYPYKNSKEAEAESEISSKSSESFNATKAANLFYLNQETPLNKSNNLSTQSTFSARSQSFNFTIDTTLLSQSTEGLQKSSNDSISEYFTKIENLNTQGTSLYNTSLSIENITTSYALAIDEENSSKELNENPSTITESENTVYSTTNELQTTYLEKTSTISTENTTALNKQKEKDDKNNKTDNSNEVLISNQVSIPMPVLKTFQSYVESIKDVFYSNYDKILKNFHNSEISSKFGSFFKIIASSLKNPISHFTSTTKPNNIQTEYELEEEEYLVDSNENGLKSTKKTTRKPFLFHSKLNESVEDIDDNKPSMIQSQSTTPELSEIERKISLLRDKKKCVFPFIYKNKTFNQCITLDKKFPWCSLSDNYDQDELWKFCDDPHLNTIGGNSNGSKCYFPFKYKGKYYNNCIDREYQTVDGTITYSKFCSTTDDFDRDGYWGYCLDYSECHFPFYYNGNVYSNCISNSLSPSFCSTTYDFNKDKQWMHCPVVCPGYPEKSQNVLSFDYLDRNGACHPREHAHRLNGLKLRDYVLPPCTLDYTCEPGYKKLFNSIKCRIDGSYDRKAFCVSEELIKNMKN